ncbi:3525_t:CDS:2, partial [Diversispora eburnea]
MSTRTKKHNKILGFGFFDIFTDSSDKQNSLVPSRSNSHSSTTNSNTITAPQNVLNTSSEDREKFNVESSMNARSSVRNFQEIINQLAHANQMDQNLILHKIIYLMEKPDIYSDDDVTTEMLQKFVIQSALYLGNHEIKAYNEATAELELLLRAMSSLVHLASKVSMLETSIRGQLYDSVAKFWNVSQKIKYRTNPSITFSLREIRNCLKKIKSDETNMEVTTRISKHFAEAAALIATKEYIGALGSVAKIATFEYKAGKWYDDWVKMRDEFFKTKNYLEKKGSVKKDLVKKGSEKKDLVKKDSEKKDLKKKVSENFDTFITFWNKLYDSAKDELKK